MVLCSFEPQGMVVTYMEAIHLIERSAIKAIHTIIKLHVQQK